MPALPAPIEMVRKDLAAVPFVPEKEAVTVSFPFLTVWQHNTSLA